MNGPHLSNSILNFLKSRNNWKKWDKNSSRRRLEKNLTNKCKKKEEKNKDKNIKSLNILNFNNNRPNYMMKGKNKKNLIIKKRFNSKKKWGIDKLKIKVKGKKLIKRKKMNLISYWFKKSKNKLHLRSKRLE